MRGFAVCRICQVNTAVGSCQDEKRKTWQTLNPSRTMSDVAACRAVRRTWRPRGLSKWVISRVISTLNGVALIITLLITDLLSPLGLQEG